MDGDEYGNQNNYYQQQQNDAYAAQQQRDADQQRAFYDQQQQNQQFYQQQQQLERDSQQRQNEEFQRQANQQYAEQEYGRQVQEDHNQSENYRLGEEERTRLWQLQNYNRETGQSQAYYQGWQPDQNHDYGPPPPDWMPAPGSYHPPGQPVDFTRYAPQSTSRPIDLTLYSPVRDTSEPANAPARAKPQAKSLWKKLLSNLFIAVIALGGFGVWKAETVNDTVVYGRTAPLITNGHAQKADFINSSQLVDPSMLGRVRRLALIPPKFEFTRTAVIQGGISNMKLYSPRDIKIVGDVDDCTIVAPNGIVYIVGGVKNHSVIEARRAKATDGFSDDSGVSR